MDPEQPLPLSEDWLAETPWGMCFTSNLMEAVQLLGGEPGAPFVTVLPFPGQVPEQTTFVLPDSPSGPAAAV